jgi:hypothetical protein
LTVAPPSGSKCESAASKYLIGRRRENLKVLIGVMAVDDHAWFLFRSQSYSSYSSILYKKSMILIAKIPRVSIQGDF